MFKRLIHTVVSLLALFTILHPALAWAHGDKVIPQVVDGAQSGGLRYITRFDLTNISYSSSATQPLTKVTLLFFTADGKPWTVSTKDQGVTSAVPVTISATQTVRVETTGTGAITSGYAILRNQASTTYLPDDNDVVITVYYEILQGNNVINTVSVPVGQPTVSCTFPVEIDMTQTPNLLTGFAIVNLINAANTVEIDLYSGDGTQFGQRATLTQNASSENVGFLNEAQFFNLPANTKFKGSAFVTSAAPVTVIPLLLTPTSTGPQYATLVPTYLDALRTNTLMYLEQGYALDADLPGVDYFHDETNTIDSYDEGPWDVLFHTVSSTARQLLPQNGAMVSTLGVYNGQSMIDQFDAISLSDLLSKKYSINPIDLSDNNSTNLQDGFAFAIKTNLGRYAKVRVRYIISWTGGDDLVLEIHVFK